MLANHYLALFPTYRFLQNSKLWFVLLPNWIPVVPLLGGILSAVVAVALAVTLGVRALLLQALALSKHCTLLRLLQGIQERRIRSIIRDKSRKTVGLQKNFFLSWACIWSLKNNYIFLLPSYYTPNIFWFWVLRLFCVEHYIAIHLSHYFTQWLLHLAPLELENLRWSIKGGMRTRVGGWDLSFVLLQNTGTCRFCQVHSKDMVLLFHHDDTVIDQIYSFKEL